MKTIFGVVFLIIILLCVYFRSEPIENDLTGRSVEALQAASLPLPNMSFESGEPHPSNKK